MSWKATIWNFKGIINTAFVFPSCMFSIGSKEGRNAPFPSIHGTSLLSRPSCPQKSEPRDECMHCLPSTSPDKHWFLFSFHSCWHLFVFLWDGIGYVTCFPALTFVCHFNDIQDSSKAKDTLRTISGAKDTAGRKTSNGSLSFLLALGLIFILVCKNWKCTHMDASRACPISLPFIQYRTHGSRSQNAPKTFHKLFLIYRIPSPTIKNYSTFFFANNLPNVPLA